MTVAALPAVAEYVEDGISKSFPVPFRFKAPTDLVVERLVDGAVSLLSIGADYAVSGGSTDAGGTITRSAATIGATLRIRRETSRAQTMRYPTGGRFPAESHEDALDRQMLVSQEQDAALVETSGRALLVPPGQTVRDIVPAPNSALVFDAQGNPVAKPIGSFPPGPVGGNVMAVGVFTSYSSIDLSYLPGIPDRIRFSGHSQKGVGAFEAVYDATINALNLGNYTGWAVLCTQGGGFKLSPDQPLSLAMFGWKTDYVSPTQRGTDNAPVIARLKSFLAATSDFRNGLYRYTPEIRMPLGRGYTTVPLNFDYGTVSLVGVGQGTTDSDGLGGSVIVCAENTAGVIINSADTSGESNRPLSFGSTGSLVTGITCLSLGGTPGNTADGFRARGQFSFTNCIAIGFPRHGFNCSADLSGQGGNTNASFMMNCNAVRNYLDGFYSQGGDSNAITTMHLNARFNGRCGINQAQFLANSLFGYHLEGNGTNDSGPRSMPQQPGALCYYSGNYYAIYPGRAADASNSTPGVDPLIWVLMGPGTPFPIYPTYTAGKTWSEGSAMRITSANAQNVVVGGYTEPGQPPVFVGGGGMLLGGQQDAGVIGSNAYLSVSGGLLTAKGFQTFDGTQTVRMGGTPELRLYHQYRTKGFFPWNWTAGLAGELLLGGGESGNNAIAIRHSDGQVRIPRPSLARLQVENAITPVATSSITRMVPFYDATGVEIGLIEVKARA